MWRPEDNFVEPLLSSHIHMGSRDPTQAVRSCVASTFTSPGAPGDWFLMNCFIHSNYELRDELNLQSNFFGFYFIALIRSVVFFPSSLPHNLRGCVQFMFSLHLNREEGSVVLWSEQQFEDPETQALSLFLGDWGSHQTPEPAVLGE